MRPRPWRLLAPDLDGSDAPWNMAVDESLLESVILDGTLPTVRVYTWPTSVSTGRFQAVAECGDAPLSIARCVRLGLPMVRRITGGRALLHGQDLSYSVAMPHGGTGIIESYREICEAITIGLLSLGIAARHGTARCPRSLSPADCFKTLACADLVVASNGADRKIVGSAQVRRRTALLQHGSIPMAWNRPLRAAIFGDHEPSQAMSLADHGIAIDMTRVTEAVVDGFRALWGPEVERNGLTGPERDRAFALAICRYGSLEWTLDRPVNRPLTPSS